MNNKKTIFLAFALILGVGLFICAIVLIHSLLLALLF